MKKLKTSTIVELKESLEDNQEKPYYIERIETKDSIIWYGYNTNWKYEKSNQSWYKLIRNKFVKTDIPIYETEYLNIEHKEYF